MFIKSKYIATGLACAAMTVPASAATLIVNNDAPHSQVVHNNFAGSGNILNLLSTPGGYAVIASSTNTLNAGNGNGFASITGTGQGRGNGFSNIKIDPIVGFSHFQFNIADFGGSQSTRGDNFDIQVNFAGGGSQLFSDVLMNANGKYNILAGQGEVLDSILLSGLVTRSGSPVNFRLIRQISFKEILIQQPSPVPQPATWIMMLSGFAAIGLSMRQRKTKNRARIRYID
jgi:PEP-CTERM motif